MVGKAKKAKASASPAASESRDSTNSTEPKVSKSPIAEFGSRDAPAKKTLISTSKRAGLVMPCSRVLNLLRKGKYANIIQRGERPLILTVTLTLAHFREKLISNLENSNLTSVSRRLDLSHCSVGILGG